jgi:hypothetical protein
MKVIKISLKNIIKGGAVCANPSIVWESPYCGNIKCIENDGKLITLEIPDECIGECLYAIITCDDTCSTCEPIKIKVCPCDTNLECADCEECIDGLCVSKCPDKPCVNGECADCNDKTPCPCNQVCTNGDCNCPPNKPFKNDKGCCVDCKTDANCPPCHKCTPNGCVPIECDGVCDPSTNKCVECNNSGDCKGENECCKDNKCGCCDGFVRNPITKKCEPAPDCVKDKDCPECHICMNGKCVPLVCPDGFICVGGNCVQECDCNAPNCPSGKSCITSEGGKCYCKGCTGDCQNGCSEGCYCKDNKKCAPNPCASKTCNNGLDCGKDCGCKNGNCVPCDSLSCEECANTIGCECKNGKCGKVVSCTGDCATSSDCANGCTCHEGQCVNCKEFNCSECGTKNGCKCEGGKCDDNPNDNDCTDTFKLIKDDANCDLKAELTSNVNCACSKLTVASKIVAVKKYVVSGTVPPPNALVLPSVDTYEYKFDFAIELRKGMVALPSMVNTLSLLGDTTKPDIADNDTPTTGVVEMVVTPYYKTLNANGSVVSVSASASQSYLGAYNLNDTHIFKDIKIEKAGDKKAPLLFVDRVEVTFNHKSKFEMPSGCEYKGDKLFSYTFTTNSNFDGLVNGSVLKDIYTKNTTLSSSKARKPLFVWYRSKDNTFTDNEIIRKVYVSKVGGKYSDVLRGMDKIDPKGKYPTVGQEGLLWSGYSYSVKTDCTCGSKVAEHLDLAFCNPKPLFYELSECNRKVKLKAPFEPCDMNQDINIWKSPTNFIPNDAQAKYELYFNGVKVATFKHDKNLGMVKDGTTDTMFDTYTSAVEITKIELKHSHDKSGDCTLTYNLVSPSNVDVLYTKNCNVQGGSYTITVPKNGNGYSVVGIVGGVVTNSGAYFTVTLPKGVPTELTFTLANGCIKKKTVSEDCCDEFNATLTAVDGECGEPLVLSTTTVGGNPPFAFTYNLPNGTSLSGGNTITIPNYIGGQYSVTVKDANNCEKIVTTNVNAVIKPNIVLSGYSSICAGQSTQLVINVDALGVGGTLTYKLNGIPQTVVVPQNGTITLPNITTPSTFNTFVLSVGGCQYGYSDEAIISVADSVDANITGSATICSGSTTNLTIIGTAGATVVINNGVGAKVIPNCGSGTCSLTVAVSPTTNTTYAITSVNLGNCNGTFGGSAAVVVNQGTAITYTESCPNSTTKQYVFNEISTAVDNNGNTITITNKTISVPTTLQYVDVTYNNGNCITSKRIYVEQCPCPNVAGSLVIDIPSTICAANGYVTASLTGTPSGTAPYTYLWDSGETTQTVDYSIATAGTYRKTVTITDANGCSSVITKTYTVSPIPLVTIWAAEGGGNITGQTYTTSAGSVQFTGNAPNSGTFSWSDGANTYSGNIITITSRVSYTLTLTYTATNDCTKTVSANIVKI